MISCPGFSVVQDIHHPSKVSYSILLHFKNDLQRCNMGCKYCMCKIDLNGHNDISIDEDAMIKTILDTNEKRGVPNPSCYHFELWGGEPTYNKESIDEVRRILIRHFPESTFSTTTNGLLLGNDDIADWLIKSFDTVQLSHDGISQKYARNVDPFEYPKANENIKALIQMGKINIINCTVNNHNPCLYDYVDFWWKKFKEWGKTVRVKLNHPFNSDYSFDFAFTDEGAMDKYCSSFLWLYDHRNEPKYRPFSEYIKNEVDKAKLTVEHPGSCRLYHQGKQDWTFIIMSNGGYGDCDLGEHTPEGACNLPEYCNDCEFKDYDWCHSCGAMKYPEKCVFNRYWLARVNKGRVKK